MALFNIVTASLDRTTGRPYGYRFDVSGVETVDEAYALLRKEGCLIGDRVSAGGGRTRIVLGLSNIGQLSLAAADSRAGSRNLHSAESRSTIAREKRVLSVIGSR